MSSVDRSGATWRSLHVHRYGAQDEFLTEGLAPMLAPLRPSRAVTGFYFLRYWQGGHHIRLRLRIADDAVEQVLDEVTAKLAGYLAEYPSGQHFDAEAFGEAQVTMAGLENEQTDEIHPADTIRRAEYAPEYDKYGGPRGVAIAETFFEASSGIVLDALRQLGGNNSRRLGAAFTMMLRGLCAAGLSPTASAGFFAHYCLLWSPYIFDEFLVTWPALVDRRREDTRRHAEAVLAGREALAADPFAAAVQRACHEVAASEEVLPAVTLAGPDATADRRREVLLVSYLHTHNNRLGVIPQQEAFLGFLGHHALSACAGTEPRADLLETLRSHRAHRLGWA